MIPTDPKKAQKLGQEWGEVITDSVFGIVDTVKHAKAVKEHNKNTVEANKGISAQNKILRDIAIKELAAEQERAALDKLTPAQKHAYYKQKTLEAKAAAQAKKEEEQRIEERNAMLTLIVSFLILLPILIWAILIISGVMTSDNPNAYRLMKNVPGVQSIVGKP